MAEGQSGQDAGRHEAVVSECGDDELRLASLELTPDLFVELCKSMQGTGSRRFIVKANPLPDDAKVESVFVGINGSIWLVLRSKEFDAIPITIPDLPHLPPVAFETVYESIQMVHDSEVERICNRLLKDQDALPTRIETDHLLSPD